jgi:hypothetical protein
MNITIQELRRAIKQCTPGAPDSYADRLWEKLEQAREDDADGGQVVSGCVVGGGITQVRYS